MPAANRSLHQVVENDLREKILSGDWAPDTMISSENQLSAQYNISRMTARTAITHLVGAGLLYRIPGKGTFVAAPHSVPRTPSYVCIRDQLEQQGTKIETRVLLKEERMASQKACEALNLPAGSNIFYVESIRYADDEPVYISRTAFSPRILPNYLETEIGKKKTCDILLDNYGITTSHVTETLMSTVSTFDEAEHLNIMPGYPLLFVAETQYTQDNQPYEYNQLIFRGDKIMLSFDFVVGNQQ